MTASDDGVAVEFPGRPHGPVRNILVRLGIALGLILFVGTTLEILAQRSRDAYRRARWKRTLNDHIIICGFGVKGRSALRTLLAKNVNRDDTAVLVTLTARELNPGATIVAAVREEENVHLLHQSGASSVVTSADAAGRLLGFAVQQPEITEVLEDLMRVGQGLDIAEHVVGEDEAGPIRGLDIAGPVVHGRWCLLPRCG